MKPEQKSDIADLEQKSHHLSSLLDAFWQLVTAENRLEDHEVALLLECQLRARQVSKSVREAVGPLNMQSQRAA